VNIFPRHRGRGAKGYLSQITLGHREKSAAKDFFHKPRRKLVARIHKQAGKDFTKSFFVRKKREKKNVPNFEAVWHTVNSI